jgi:hypothetical protein
MTHNRFTDGGYRIAAALGVLLLAAACTQTLKRVNSESYGWGPQQGVTLAKVQATIEKTAYDLGWEVVDTKPGSFTAKRSWDYDKHNIAVDVVYDLKTFSLRYKDSKALGYDGRSIHHSYNVMVAALEDRIKAKVSTLAP